MIAAQDAMKEVAMFINEDKRRMENIGKIGMWQETIDNWKVCPFRVGGGRERWCVCVCVCGGTQETIDN